MEENAEIETEHARLQLNIKKIFLHRWERTEDRSSIAAPEGRRL